MNKCRIQSTIIPNCPDNINDVPPQIIHVPIAIAPLFKLRRFFAKNVFDWC